MKVLGRAVIRKYRVNENRIGLEAEGPARSQGLIRATKIRTKAGDRRDGEEGVDSRNIHRLKSARPVEPLDVG